MTAQEIAQAVMRRRSKLGVFLGRNLVPLRWEECDVIEVSQHLLFHEFEIKISRADYLRDFSKTIQLPRERRTEADWNKRKHDLLKDRYDLGPSYFWFVCPVGLIDKAEVPEYAGLYYVSEVGGCWSVKQAPRLHSTKFSADRVFNLLVKAPRK